MPASRQSPARLHTFVARGQVLRGRWITPDLLHVRIVTPRRPWVLALEPGDLLVCEDDGGGPGVPEERAHQDLRVSFFTPTPGGHIVRGGSVHLV